MRTIAIVVLLILASYASAQTPAYDVSTVRPSASTVSGTNFDISETGFTATGITPIELLHLAFDLPSERIMNLSSDAASGRYDITAKPTEATAAELTKLTDAQIRTMVQNLLVERFGLKWHMEKRTVPAFDLVFEKKADHLRPSATAPKDQDDEGEGELTVRNRHLQAKGVRIGRLAEFMGNELHRPVVDKTGLKGAFDTELHWRRDDLGADEAAADDPTAPPPLTTAIKEQLGLRLRSAHELSDVLVIDNWQAATPN